MSEVTIDIKAVMSGGAGEDAVGMLSLLGLEGWLALGEGEI